MKRNALLTATLATTAIFCMSYLAPRGWHTSGSAEAKYDMGTLRYGGHDSKSCGTIKSTKGHYFNDDYGLLMQTFPAKKYLGRRLRLTGFMKTKDVKDWSGFMLRADKDGKKDPVAFDNMFDRKITGSNNWQEYRVELDIPEDASSISFGALVNGPGQIWFDDISFEVVSGAPVPADTAKPGPAHLPMNLDFEM